MSFECNKCGKQYQWKKSLKRHKEREHKSKQYRECVYCDKAFESEKELFRHKAKFHGFYDWTRDSFVPPRTDVSVDKNELLTDEFQKVGDNFEVTMNPNFKFKHPFCMMVAGPSRSGKTHWVMNLLKAKSVRIDPLPSDPVVYCYMHWQPHYDEIQSFAPNTRFRQGLPTAYFIKSLENCVVILDDLMDAAMKDLNIMSMFTEGSHHRKVSVIFLSQNIFHQGKHSRTMSLNVQYMVLFKNARDQSQIQTLARQMFPTDWRHFINHYKEETSKEFGHVILDLHPRTPDNQRVVLPFKEQVPIKSAMEQFYQMSNPFSQPLREAEQKMYSVLHDKSMTLEEKATAHSEALRTFTLMREKYEQHERQKRYAHLSPTATSQRPPGIQIPSGIESSIVESPEIETQPVRIVESERIVEPDSTDSLHIGDILPDGTDPKMLSHGDKPEDRKRKMDYIQKHVNDKASTEEGIHPLDKIDTLKKPSAKRSKDDDKSYNLRK